MALTLGVVGWVIESATGWRRPNVLRLSAHAGQCRPKPNELVREAVGYSGVLGCPDACGYGIANETSVLSFWSTSAIVAGGSVQMKLAILTRQSKLFT